MKCKEMVRGEPEDYYAWVQWAGKKVRTHNQLRCGKCGKWHIWKEKK